MGGAADAVEPHDIRSQRGRFVEEIGIIPAGPGITVLGHGEGSDDHRLRARGSDPAERSAAGRHIALGFKQEPLRSRFQENRGELLVFHSRVFLRRRADIRENQRPLPACRLACQLVSPLQEPPAQRRILRQPTVDAVGVGFDSAGAAGDIGLVYAQNRIRILQIRQFRVSRPIPWERQRLIIGTEGAVKQ